mmetsp:Transcript_78373/g.196785  ORF Transcript_78373/g.196785 Transcript_78373/m.196785 type:complete len:230 (+) Transcript_78373:150-839(+)
MMLEPMSAADGFSASNAGMQKSNFSAVRFGVGVPNKVGRRLPILPSVCRCSTSWAQPQPRTSSLMRGPKPLEPLPKASTGNFKASTLTVHCACGKPIRPKAITASDLTSALASDTQRTNASAATGAARVPKQPRAFAACLLSSASVLSKRFTKASAASLRWRAKAPAAATCTNWSSSSRHEAKRSAVVETATAPILPRAPAAAIRTLASSSFKASDKACVLNRSTDSPM